MPRIIDYDTVLQHLQEQGLRCLYHNAGAFGFPPQEPVYILGWIGPDDPTIRPAMWPHIRRVHPPFVDTLARLATEAWQIHLSADAWVMPMSHWTYELDHGNRTWLPAALEQIGISPDLLQHRNNGSAIAFSHAESGPLNGFLQNLLQHLAASDFMIAFPGIPVLCTIHHHQQLWWQTTDQACRDALLNVISHAAPQPQSHPSR